MKANTDGASRGNPGRGGFGIVLRNKIGDVQGVMVQNLMIRTSYMDECHGILAAAEKPWAGYNLLLCQTQSLQWML
ncbi:hypothetical protein GIB67_020801 [Kingdonia uniflora]|uniref:RNase H type-1 domain-containing protein n=1 Tax=Kingdonia uniflora TaxID=39325 RepID=A0A7J7M7J3_9MAGN|nr:hypothetical protein GIB67_020801 [Kingdonia uniflora]